MARRSTLATLVSTFLCLTTLLAQVAAADSPLAQLEVVSVSPKRVIKHEIELQGLFDRGLAESQLVGPERFCRSVRIANQPAAAQRAVLTWYKIVEPAAEPRRTLTVRDGIHGDESYEIQIESPSYLLAPAKQVTTGVPQDIPEELNYFKAYRVVRATRVSHEVRLSDALGPSHRTAKAVAFFCVPAEQRHHNERHPVKNKQDCLIVYELSPQPVSGTASTIDLFGLNELKLQASEWLCVRAAMLDTAAVGQE